MVVETPGGKLELVESKSVFARMKGLLGRESLERGSGILLKGRQVHTLGMRFDIEAIHLSRDGEVLVVKHLRKWRVGPFVRRSRWILEVGAGEASRLGIAPGVSLRIFSGAGG